MSSSSARNGREFWDEIWPIIGPEVEGVMEQGISTWHEDHLVPIFRNGRMEEVYWTYSYSPVLQEDDSVGGTLVIVQETTQRVLAERRMTMLNELSERMLVEEQTVSSGWQAATDVLQEYDADFPFALLYSVNRSGGVMHLVGKSGRIPDELAPSTIDPFDAESNDLPWDVASVIRNTTLKEVSGLSDRFGPMISGRWQEAIDRAVVIRVALTPTEPPVGVLVAGISPRLEFDEPYRHFLQLAATQIATGIANRRAIEDMEAAASMKDQFLSLVSHELRSPIGTVVGNALMLLKYAAVLSDEDKSQALESIISEGQRLQRVIENLLVMTRMEASAHSPFTALPIERVVAAQVDAFAQRKPERNLVVSDQTSGARVHGEETLVGMVLENLISNADKYSPPDVAIEVSATTEGQNTLQLRVRDYGIGIADEDAANLFTPFFRSDGARQYASGMGLGLAVCKRIVEAHGGEIWIERRPEGGTDFVVSLPLIR